MATFENDQRVNEERERIFALLADFNVPKKRVKLLEPLVENVAWMKVKLDDARQAIKNSSVVIPYDNGGGQKGLRENPLFKGYESLWKSYVSGMDKIISALPEEAEQPIDDTMKPKSVLEIVRERHG